jgi:pimeloyl-ACP methyl ester carboxylesterase
MKTVRSTELRSTRIAGADLVTRHRGEGAPVLLLHGVPGDLESLAPVADNLADRWHAITLSLRYSNSDCAGDRPFGTVQQRDDLRDLIPRLGAGPVHVVAWSYSAHAALALAMDAPHLVQSLFLYEPGFPTFVEDEDARQRVHEDMMQAFGPVFDALFREDLSRALRLSIDAAAGRTGWFDAQPARVRDIHQRSAHMLRLLSGQTDPISLGPAGLGGLRIPVTISWGSATRDCYRIVAESAARLIPGALGCQVVGEGHLFPETDPDRFASAVRAHLEQVAAQTP